MRKIGSEQESNCEHCGKPLFGRTDKRFCNDTCRNTFNRQKAEQEKLKAYESLPEIIRVIKQNYELLKAEARREIEFNEEVYLELDKMLQKGFNPKFFTSILEEKGVTWRFCFERGWRVIDTTIYIRDLPEQAEVLKKDGRPFLQF